MPQMKMDSLVDNVSTMWLLSTSYATHPPTHMVHTSKQADSVHFEVLLLLSSRL
jgi:hypothetical protein